MVIVDGTGENLMSDFEEELAARLSDPGVAFDYIKDAAANSEPDELYQAIELVSNSMSDSAQRQALAVKAYHELLFTLPRAALFAGMDAQEFEKVAGQ